ncbi:hypothetical protein CEP51_012593 [Fusarium floridanum]|uniref:Uncharacterized protein n=2 Tax=Fusarium solani species complex TaxID=232080 RepID=A0A428QRK7_9HYPO|nr:hypothetical protein CEP51_012593 [Fusarium floridanum]RSM19275.1 hypothetical protein CDV31_001953 [Fusarium ambrosium]
MEGGYLSYDGTFGTMSICDEQDRIFRCFSYLTYIKILWAAAAAGWLAGLNIHFSRGGAHTSRNVTTPPIWH